MIEGMSSSPSESQYANQARASMIAIKQASESEQQIAEMIVQQVQETAAAAAPSSNPPHLGANVDTYA